MIDTVIFDWGGTLSIWAEVEMADMWRRAADGLDLGSTRDRDIVADELVRCERRLWAECAGEGGHTSFTLADIFGAVSERLGFDIDSDVLDRALNGHLDSWTPHIRHHDDAESTLRALDDAGIRIGLVSNTHWPRSFHEHFLCRDGLSRFISTRIYSSEQIRMKPHREIFELAMTQLGSSPAHTLFVGDRLYDDVHGAQSAGMRAVWKHTAQAAAAPGIRPDFVINRLSELPAIVAGLNKNAGD